MVVGSKWKQCCACSSQFLLSQDIIGLVLNQLWLFQPGFNNVLVLIPYSDVPYDPFDGYVDTRGVLDELKAHWLPLFQRLDDGKSGKSYPAINIKDIR